MPSFLRKSKSSRAVEQPTSSTNPFENFDGGGGGSGLDDDIDQVTDPSMLDSDHHHHHHHHRGGGQQQQRVMSMRRRNSFTGLSSTMGEQDTSTNDTALAGDISDLTLDVAPLGPPSTRRSSTGRTIQPLAPSARDGQHRQSGQYNKSSMRNVSRSSQGPHSYSAIERDPYLDNYNHGAAGIGRSGGAAQQRFSSARQLYDELNSSMGSGMDMNMPPQSSRRQSMNGGGGGREVGLDQKLASRSPTDHQSAESRSRMSGSTLSSGAKRSQSSRRLGTIRASIRAESTAVDVDRITEEMEHHAAIGRSADAGSGYGGGFDERIEVGDVNADDDNDNDAARRRSSQQRRRKSFKGASQHSSLSRVTEHAANGGNGSRPRRRPRQMDADADADARMLERDMGTGTIAADDDKARRKEAVRKSKLQKIQELQVEVRDLKKANRELRREQTAMERKRQNDQEENRLHVGVLEGRLRAAGLKDDVSNFTGASTSRDGTAASGDLGMVLKVNRTRSDGADSANSSFSDVGSGDVAARADAMKALSEAAYKNKIALSVAKQKLGRVEDQLDTTTRRCEELEDEKVESEYQLQQARVEMDRLRDQLAKAQETADAAGGGVGAANAISATAKSKADEKTLKDLRSRNALLKEEWEKSEERASDLMKKLDVKQKEVEETRREMEDQISKAVEVEMKLQETKQKHKEEKDRWEKEREEAMAAVNAAGISTDAIESKRSLNEEESDVGSQSGPMAAIAALQEELQSIRAARDKDRERFEERLQEAREEAAADAANQISKNAMRESERRDDLRREADEALAEVDALHHELELARQDIDVEREVAKETAARYDESVAEVDKLRNNLSKTKDELLEVRNELSNVERKHRSDMNEAEMIFRESARELEDAKAEMSRLEQDLDRAREELARAEADIVKIQTAEQESADAAGRVQNEIVKNELARAKEEIERLLQEKSKREADADASMRELKTESDREVVKVREELAAALEDLSKARTELEVAKEKVVDLEKKSEQDSADADDVVRLTAQLAEARDQLSAKEREMERLQTNIESAKEEVDNMWDRCDRLEEDNRALEDEIEELTKHHDEELDQLKDQVSNSRKELERKNKSAESMGKQMSELQSELESAKSRVEMLERQVANLKSNAVAAQPTGGGFRQPYGGDDAMSVSVRSGASGQEDTVGATSQADMLASAAAAAQAKGGRGRRFGSRLFRGSAAVPQVDADGNLTPEGQLAEKNIRIAELESQLDENVDAIRKLESEMVVLRTTYKDEEYKAKKKIEKLQEENTQYAVKVALLENKLLKTKKGGSTDTSAHEGLAAMGETEITPSFDDAEENKGDTTVKVDATYLGQLRNDVDKGKSEIEELQSDIDAQKKSYGEMESRLRSEVETLQKERDELEDTLASQQELLTQQRLSEVEDLKNKLEVRDSTLLSLKGTLADLSEKESIIVAKNETITALKKQCETLNQQLSLMVKEDMDSDGQGEDNGERQKLAAETADDAIASAAAFDSLM